MTLLVHNDDTSGTNESDPRWLLVALLASTAAIGAIGTALIQAGTYYGGWSAVVGTLLVVAGALTAGLAWDVYRMGVAA